MKPKLPLKKLIDFWGELTFIKAARFCLYVYVVFIPFQVKYFFQVLDIYESGQLNIYTNFFLYLSDIFLIFALILYGLAYLTGEGQRVTLKLGDKRLFALLLVFILLIEASSFWAFNELQAFVTTIRFVELLLFYLLILNTGCQMQFLVRLLLYTIVAQALIGVFQYILQSSIGFHFLGEPLLAKNVPGVAKVDLGDVEFLRSYGTFAHPNIFGGFLVLGTVLAFSRLSEDRILYGGFIAFFLIVLVLTFSRSAWIALTFASLFYVFITRPRFKIKYVLLATLIGLLFLVVFDLDKLVLNRISVSYDEALTQRTEYMEISKNMFLKHPFGVGIGNFTLEMQGFSEQKIRPWDLQPVHNVFLLALNEVGFVIFPVFIAIIVYIFVAVQKKSKEFVSGGDRKYGTLLLGLFFALLVIMNLDHYPFSLYQGQFLLFFYLLLVNDFVLRKVPV
ncbi:MAG: O-antigen ligase family protein [Patescibacteria group bacterium]|nr:O-antigen ligase family protein [Patescibacteria group bacterium]